MSATTLLLIIQAFQAAIGEAPTIIDLVDRFKETIATLFQNGLIDAAKQDALMAHADALMNAALAGEVPPSWQVEPDPTDDRTPGLI